MSPTQFSVQSTSFYDEKGAVKIELESDPNDTSKCCIRLTYDDGHVFETWFNRNGGQVNQFRYDDVGQPLKINEADADLVLQPDPNLAQQIALDPADIRNQSSRAANDRINTTSSLNRPAAAPMDHNEALAKSGLGQKNPGFAGNQPQPAANFRGVDGQGKPFANQDYPANAQPRPDQGVPPNKQPAITPLPRDPNFRPQPVHDANNDGIED